MRSPHSPVAAAAQSVLDEAILAIARSIQALHGAGATTFLVWRAPNVGVTPAIRMLDRIKPGAAQLGSQLTQAFNAKLDLVVTQLSALPGIRIVRLDAYRLLNDLVADPAAFGLTERGDGLRHTERSAVHLLCARMSFCSGTASIPPRPCTRSSRRKRLRSWRGDIFIYFRTVDAMFR